MGHKATSGANKRKKNPANETKDTKSQDKEDGTNSAPPNTPMGSMGPVAPKYPDLICPHLSYVRLEKLKRKILTPTAWSCSECGTTEGVWACLTCGKIGCGRYQSEHALSHYEDYQHPLALEINLSYCYCYQCDQYVTTDNKKEDLENIRKLILKAQTVDESTSTTRSGKAIRPPVKIPTNSEFKDEDRLHTAVKHWRLLTLGKAFNSWKAFVADEKRQKQLEDAQSPELAKSHSSNSTADLSSPSSPSAPDSHNSNSVTPPPVPRTKTSFLTQSTQRALASPSSSRRIIPGITGLRNLGNTCFMNTVLQALSNTSEFRDFFVHMLGATQPKEGNEEVKEKGDEKGDAKAKGKVKEKEPEKEVKSEEEVVAVVLNGKRYTRQPTLELLDTIRKHVPKLEEVSLAMEVHSLLRVLWSGKWAVVTPCALLESVWKFVPKFRNRQQQDAQEFLCYLFDRLQLELSHANSALGPPPEPAPPPPRSSSRKRTKEKEKDKDKENNKEETEKSSRRKRGRSPSPPPASLPPTPLSGDQSTIITETFQGKLCSIVTCDVCKTTSTKLDPFLDLSVDIPVVSLAKPHRKKKRTSTKTKPKTKTKQNGTSKEDEPPSPNTSTDKDDTTDKMDTTDNTASKTTNTNNNNTTEEGKALTTLPPTSTPPSSTSDSDTESGPLSCDLADCLASFIKEEKVEGYSCSKCNEKRSATKRLYLYTLPHVLCIVLKRFSWTATSRAKIDTHVNIPFTLDVSDYMLPLEKKEKDKANNKEEKKEKGRGEYELRSVVMHHGAGLLSGHYTSYCYNELQDTWVHYNDARVSLVSKEQVERDIPSQAYLMFYQRISTTGTFLAPIFPLLPSISPAPQPPSPPTSPYAPPTTAAKPKRLKK